MLEWFINNKEWVFSGVGILILSVLGNLFKNMLEHKKKDDSTQSNVNITVNKNTIPKLIVKARHRECNIVNPEIYSDINSFKDIKNYRIRFLQQLVDELGIEIINVGDSYAKNVSIDFQVKKEECLLTNSNILWIFESLMIENYKKDRYDELLKQSYEIPILEVGERIRLPLNENINGIIISCLFNCTYFINFDEKDFSEIGDIYEDLKSNLPLKPPELNVFIKYSDEEGAIRNIKYKIIFNIKFQQMLEFLRVEYVQQEV